MRLFPSWLSINTWAAWLRLYQWWLMSGWVVIMAMILTSQYLWSRHKRSTDTRGAASFATRREMRAAGLFEGDGVILGEVGYLWWREYVRVGSEHNVLVIGGKGTGKTTVVGMKSITALPKISLIIFDLKGELVRLTQGYRQLVGPTYVFHPGHERSDRLNPLDLIRWGTSADVRDSQTLATQLSTAEADSPHQRQTSDEANYYKRWARILLSGATLYIHDAKEWTGPRSCAGLLELFSRSGASVRKTLEDLARSKDDVVRKVASLVLQRSQKDQQEVFSAAVGWLFPWTDPVLAHNTNETTIPIDQLQHGTDPMTLYLRFTPDDVQGRLRPIARLVPDQIITRITERDPWDYTHELKWVFEDMAELGYYQKVENINQFYREHGWSFLGMVQSANQIWKHYGRDTSLFDNCDTLVVFQPNNPDTQEFFSRKLGKTTVQETSGGQIRPQLRLFGQTSVRTSSQERALLRPEELGKIGQKHCVVFVGGRTKNGKAVNPIIARARPYFNDKNFMWRIHA